MRWAFWLAAGMATMTGIHAAYPTEGNCWVSPADGSPVAGACRGGPVDLAPSDWPAEDALERLMKETPAAGVRGQCLHSLADGSLLWGRCLPACSYDGTCK